MPYDSTPETPIFELAEELVESWRGITRCTAEFLRAVGEFDRRHGYEDWGYVDTAQWLDAECGISRVTAREKVRVARELEGLGKIADAFADGSLSYSKVRALTRLADLGNEGLLLDLALKCPASELEARLREMENGGALCPADGDGKARHTLTRHQGNGDRARISVELSREDAGIVMEALEVAKAEIALCQLGGQRADDASLAADALLLMARRTLSGCFRGSAKASDIWFLPDTSGCIHDDPTPEQSGPAHLVMVHVEESVLRGEGGTSDLPTPAVRRLLCDGAVVGIVDDGDGSPLSIGRRTRTVPARMRRALEARDRTCRYPGCHHGRWLDAHHVVHWADGGETNLENLVLLCTHHHKLLHEGEFEIRRHETKGHYFFARPDGSPIGIDIGGAFRLGESFSALRTWGQDSVDLLELCGVPDPDSPASAEAADEVESCCS